MENIEKRTVFSSPLYVRKTPHGTMGRLCCFGYSVLLDALSIQFGVLLGILFYERFGQSGFHRPYLSIVAFAMEYTVIFCFFAYARKLYQHAHSLLEIRATAESLRVSTICLALITMTIFLHHMVVPRLMLLAGWVFTTAILVLQQHMTREVVMRWKSRTVPKRKVVILGAGAEARRIFSILSKSPDLGLQPIAFIVEDQQAVDSVIYGHDYHFRESAPVFSERLTHELLTRLEAGEIYVADPFVTDRRVGELVSLGLEHSIPISFIGSKHHPRGAGPGGVRFLDDLHVTSSMVEERSDPLYSLSKRAFDIVVSGLLLLFTAPLWAVVAVWIKRSSPGPVFFRQVRVARQGKPFEILKFRSMYVTAPRYGLSPESSSDPRVTKAGRFLRRTSLDELPQLLNVFKGDMSLVGPRPEMPFIVRDYTRLEHQRLLVPQGITGFWQLSADRKFAIHERIEYDLYYLEQKNFFFDLAILVHTAFFAMKGI